MNDPFERAFATLNRGADFVGAGLRPARASTPFLASAPVSSPYRAKVIANGLRELDRFLNLLIDEALRARGRIACPSQHNTANKLGTYWAAYGQPDVHGERLRALGRSRECLFHCGGQVLKGDCPGMETFTAGWPEMPGPLGPLRRFGVGETLVVETSDLADIGAFYRGLAREVAALTTFRPCANGRMGLLGSGINGRDWVT